MRRHLIPVLLIVGATACGGDNPLKGDAVELTSLQGSYDVIGYDCTINIDESAIWLSDCGETDGEDTWSAEGSGTISDSLISLGGDAVSIGSCWDFGLRVEASATKLEDREDSGVFSSFAGKWDGSIAFSFTDTPKAGPDCEHDDMEVERGVANATFVADVKGQLIDADYTTIEDGEAEESEPLTIAGTSDLITVNEDGGVERRR